MRAKVGSLAKALTLRDLMANRKPIRLPDLVERRRLRLAAGFSQEETALAIGAGLRTVVAWELGQNEPRRAAARRYGAALAAFRDLA